MNWTLVFGVLTCLSKTRYMQLRPKFAEPITGGDSHSSMRRGKLYVGHCLKIQKWCHVKEKIEPPRCDAICKAGSTPLGQTSHDDQNWVSKIVQSDIIKAHTTRNAY